MKANFALCHALSFSYSGHTKARQQQQQQALIDLSAAALRAHWDFTLIDYFTINTHWLVAGGTGAGVCSAALIMHSHFNKRKPQWTRDPQHNGSLFWNHCGDIKEQNPFYWLLKLCYLGLFFKHPDQSNELTVTKKYSPCSFFSHFSHLNVSAHHSPIRKIWFLNHYLSKPS